MVPSYKSILCHTDRRTTDSRGLGAGRVASRLITRHLNLSIKIRGVASQAFTRQSITFQPKIPRLFPSLILHLQRMVGRGILLFLFSSVGKGEGSKVKERRDLHQ